RWRSFTDSATENLTLFDSELRIVEINRNVLRRFGMEKEQMVGRRLHEITTDPDTLNRVERYAEVLRTGKPVAFSGRARHSRLGERVHEFRAFPVGDGVGVISTDITERKKIEAMKNEFVSVVSHELRTPLTAIMGTLQILKSGMAGALGKKAAEIVGIAEKNSERLLRLINDILDVDKIDSGGISFNMSPVRLHALVAHSVKVNRALGESDGITLKLAEEACDTLVLGDYDRLMQVMANLLSNAVKFSPEKGEVEVAVSPQNGSVRVTVRDHGGGVPEEFREHAFEKFSQADRSPSRPKGGTGLGLNICKSIVEKHSGSIDFHAVADGGTVFFFDLPEYKGDARPAPETSA
ncbi:MAG: HAMP domain-containing sensor histidine kinase, partial [bacterium]